LPRITKITKEQAIAEQIAIDRLGEVLNGYKVQQVGNDILYEYCYIVMANKPRRKGVKQYLIIVDTRKCEVVSIKRTL